MPQMTISRRKLLSSTAAGAATVSLTGTMAGANAPLLNQEWNHAAKHATYAKTLKGFLNDPLASEEAKNVARRAASCPECGVHLHPSEV